MRRLLLATFVTALLGSGGYYGVTNWKVDGLDSVTVNPRPQPLDEEPDDPPRQEPLPSPPDDTRPGQPAPPPARNGPIKIASFHLDGLDARKMSDEALVANLIEVIRTYDIVAVQDIQSQTQGVLVDLTARINLAQPRYDFVTPEHVAHGGMTNYCAFLFNETTVQVDRDSVYCVEDQADRLSRRPLVASFQCQLPIKEAAFTFSLVNVHLDADRFEEELDLLADVYRAVRESERGEDDIILLGNLGLCNGEFGRLEELPSMTWVVDNQPTTITHNRPVDNLFLHSRATSEFTGLGGVQKLTIDFSWAKENPSAASAISTHLPVWAEFSPFEGGRSVPAMSSSGGHEIQ